MSEKKIIQFEAASQVNSDAYVPITQLVNGNQKTLKALIDQLGAYISRVQQYNDLDTDAKDLIGAINEAAESGSIEMETSVTTPVSIASFNDGGDNIPVKSLKVLVSAVQSGSGTPSPSNIRSISGWSGVNVFKTGKNLFDLNFLTGTNITISNGVASGTANAFLQNFQSRINIPLKGNVVYTLSVSAYTDANQGTNGSGLRFIIKYTDGTSTTLEFLNANTTKTTKSITSSTESGKIIDYIYISFGSNGNNIWYVSDIQLEVGTSATTYEPYNGTTHTIPFGQTVYGGLFDVTKGVLTITHGYLTLNGNADETWQYYSVAEGNLFRYVDSRKNYTITDSNTLCDSYAPTSSRTNLTLSGNTQYLDFINNDYSDITAWTTYLASNPIHVVFELATPTVINLTPTQVKTLLTCNIFADTGDIDTLIYFNSNADETADVVEAYVGNVVNLYATLATGNTSVTISSSAIHMNSTIDIYTDNDVDYISAVVTEGQIVVNFDAQASNLGVKVRVS